MKIPNPFALALRVIAWPFVQLFMLALRSVRLQSWILAKFADMGVPQQTLNQTAEAFNMFNHDRGIPAKFVPPPRPEAPTVERATSDEEKTSGEAKP